jgi:soluble cytochrome b562
MEEEEPPKGFDWLLFREKALNEENLDEYSTEECLTLLDMLRGERVQGIRARRYEDSPKLSRGIRWLEKTLEVRAREAEESAARQRVAEQRRKFELALEKFDHDTDYLIRALIIRTGIRRDRMMDLHRKECEDNYNKWQGEPKMRQYNHASSVLVIQRKQLETFIEAGKLDEAEETQKYIDRLEGQEQESAVKAMMHEYQESVRRLNEKQTRESEIFEYKFQTALAGLKQRSENERMLMLNRQRKLEQKALDAAREKPKDVTTTRGIKGPLITTGKNKETKTRADLKTRTSVPRAPTTIALPKLHVPRATRQRMRR